MISASPSDHGPVFDVVLESATRLCDGALGSLLMVEGDTLNLVASQGMSEELVELLRSEPMRLDREGSLNARAVLNRQVNQPTPDPARR